MAIAIEPMLTLGGNKTDELEDGFGTWHSRTAVMAGFSAALVAETAPARAAGTTQSPSGPVPPKARPTPPRAGSASPPQLTPCRPVPPGQVTGASPAGHSQLRIGGTAHARSC